MSIKEATKRIVEAGKRIYGVVESAALGRATIRLGINGNGARLTNIPYAGNVAVGDQVIVDVSNDPVVYSILTPGVDDDDVVSSPPSIIAPPSASSFAIASIGCSKVQTASYVTTASLSLLGFYEDSGSTRYRGIYLNEAIYDPNGMIGVADYVVSGGKNYKHTGLLIQEPGTYLVSGQVAIQTDLSPWKSRGGGLLFMRGYYSVSLGYYQIGYWMQMGDARRIMDPEGRLSYYHSSAIMRLKTDDLIAMSFAHYYTNSDGENATLTSARSQGQYPKLTVAMIAPTDTSNEFANRGWFIYRGGSYTEGNRY